MENNLKESDICKLFIRNVKKLRSYNYFKTDFEILHIPNEHKKTTNRVRDISYLKHLVSMGMLAGAPDYLIIYDGAKVAAIEFKRNKAGTRLKGNQLAFKHRANELSIPYLCTYDIEQAVDFLTELLNRE